MTISRLVQAVRRLAVLAFATAAILNVSAIRAETAATVARNAAQLEQIVAPIALYPDALMSQVLMASTYPLEVVEAARWSQQNPQVAGPALEDAMQKQSWDPSVKALTAVPQVLTMMNDKLDWTQELGDAFLAQQQDVLAAVQRLRARADANGQLNSNENQKVAKLEPSALPAPAGSTAPSSGSATPIYTIAPTNPEQYYVPIYDPMTTYGAWPYADYAPFYWTPPGYYGGRALTFAAGVAAGAAIWGGVDWWRNRVDVNVNNFNRFNRTSIGNNAWAHNPAHRGGVPYRDQGVAQRFGDPRRAAAREGYRDKADAGRRDLSKQGGANRAQQGTANRPAGQAKTNAAGQGRQTGGAKQAAVAKKDGKARQAAGSKQGAQAKQAARSKQGAQAKQAARPKQATQARSAARSPQRASAQRPQARPGAGARPAGMNRGMQARPAGMHAGRGGGMRGGGGRGGRR